MAAACAICGTKLPLLQRLTGRSLCSACEQERRETAQAARSEYDSLLSQLVNPASEPALVQSQLPSVAAKTDLGPNEVKKLHLKSFGSYLDEILADDFVTEDEETRMSQIAEVLGIDQNTLEAEFADMMPRLFVARANDGRLPALPSARIILKKNEVAHLEANAALLKEVVEREYRGGYRGFSFRIVKGVRYHTGSVRGKSVVIGSHLEVADTGILTVTSQRAVYTGLRKSIEMPYAKLINLSVFDDGVQFHLSNRQNPPLFRLDRGIGNAVAAAINAASQSLLN